jgi:CheY-like chemotaxis protein
MNMSPWRVLVIDDSDTARQQIVALLQDDGFQVFELVSAIGSTREVVRHDIHAVVVDLNMPAMRGDSLVRLFRSNPRFAKLRLVLVSAEPPEVISKLAADVEVDAFVSKVDVPKQLGLVIKRLLAGAPRDGSTD